MLGGDTREWRPDWPCPVGQVWSALRRGAGDPTYRIDPEGRHWRGLSTPEGPATLSVGVHPQEGIIEGRAWGAGGSWALDHLPSMLGADDDPRGMPLLHEPVRRARHSYPHWRLGRGGSVMEALVPAVIEQKVTGQEAYGSFQRLVRFYGSPAPGPSRALDLWVQPAAAQVRMIASWQWLQLGIDDARSATLVRAARVADQLQQALTRPSEEFDRALRSVHGIGVWTSAEVRSRAQGDPDAVSFGDYHVARNIGWTLIGAEVDDARLAELLEPYRGHRYRVQRLLELTGASHPRRGPRMAPRTHLPRAGRPAR